jgi:hypothetical protein
MGGAAARSMRLTDRPVELIHPGPDHRTPIGGALSLEIATPHLLGIPPCQEREYESRSGRQAHDPILIPERSQQSGIRWVVAMVFPHYSYKRCLYIETEVRN